MTWWSFSQTAGASAPAWAAWQSSWACCLSWAMSRSVAAFWRSRSWVLRVMSSSPDWLRISTVLRKRRWLAGPFWVFNPLPKSPDDPWQFLWDSFLVWTTGPAGSLEEGGEGVWVLETDGELTLREAGGLDGQQGLRCWWEAGTVDCDREREWGRNSVWDSCCLWSLGACVVVDTSSLLSSVHTRLLKLWSSVVLPLLVDVFSGVFLLGCGAIRGYEFRIGR